MLKALGAFVFGLAAVCGVGYFILGKQKDKAMRNQIDCWVFNLGTSLKKGASNVKHFAESVITKDPVSVSGEAAA